MRWGRAADAGSGGDSEWRACGFPGLNGKRSGEVGVVKARRSPAGHGKRRAASGRVRIDASGVVELAQDFLGVGTECAPRPPHLRGRARKTRYRSLHDDAVDFYEYLPSPHVR